VPDLEFEQVFRCADAGLQLVMLLAREAGLRHGTIQLFSASNCNFERHEVSGRTKFQASYTIPMSNRLHNRLLFTCASARDAEEPLLCQFHPQRKVPCYAGMTKWLQRAKAAAGVNRPWGLHDLRRTAARAVFDRTGDVRKVQRFLGHSQLPQTWWYLGSAGKPLSQEDVEIASCRPNPDPEIKSSSSDRQSRPNPEPQQKIA
jgi:integrase